MIPLAFLEGHKVAVLGLGRSGLASAAALVASGAEVLAWDDNEGARLEADAAGVPISDPSRADWCGASLLVLSPGIPYEHPRPHPAVTAVRACGREVVGDVELLARAEPKAKLFGITGTNGKSTTTALVGHILHQAGRTAAVGGNIGTPALALEWLDADGFYVLELSSYQLETTFSLDCEVAMLLNISPDHLDRHGGWEGYVAAKRRIFNWQASHAHAVIGIDDPTCCAIFEDLRATDDRRVIPISGSRQAPGGVYLADGCLIDDLDDRAERIIDMCDAPRLPGPHNAQNAAAAYAACRSVGLSGEVIAEGLRTFSGLAHRQELVAVIEGVTYINDSKATNPDAAARALACYERIFWIAGGRAKEKGLTEIEPYLPHIVEAFLIGEAGESFARALRGKVAARQCGTLDKAVAQASETARREADGGTGVVLFSPACASFDQFADFEARGDAFRHLVKDLPGARQAAGPPVAAPGGAS
jgi:UDP-N-acetylmuramoylalanine--D-glutamate ligase